MKIVQFTDWFSEPMGYSSNFLPKALARLGHEVHVVTSSGQVYCNSPEYATVLQPFLGPPFVAPGVSTVDGFTVHRLPSEDRQGHLHISGITRKLRELRPDIVQTTHLAGPALQVAFARPLAGFKLFLECHVHASVFPIAKPGAPLSHRLRWLRYRMTIGRLISSQTERCYAISDDAGDIAVRFFGIAAHKVAVSPLGVETELFHPIADEPARQTAAALRARLGFAPDDIVCIYTGRLSAGKGPAYLAQAIGILASEGAPFKGLFLGDGAPADVAAITGQPGCVVHPYVMCRDLPAFYQAADIGVWPRQESTSQIDAAACGLPLVLSREVQVRERVEGNGLLYEEGNAADLAAQLRRLADRTVRERMGAVGAARMQAFSWDVLARQRVADYEAALG